MQVRIVQQHVQQLQIRAGLSALLVLVWTRPSSSCAVKHGNGLFPAYFPRIGAFHQKATRAVEDKAHLGGLIAGTHAHPACTLGQGDIIHCINEFGNLFIGVDLRGCIYGLVYRDNPGKGGRVSRKGCPQGFPVVFIPEPSQMLQ